jgi:transcriptional regulator of NAD metabolism
LEIMVYYGGKVQDVIVEHPYYGELKGNLMLQTMEDINNFIENINQSGAEPLSILTKGVHLHTVLAPSKVVLDKIEQELRKAGILL